MMDFHNLAYWQEKAKISPLKRGYLLTANIAPPPIIACLKPSTLPQQTLAEVARGKKADVDRAVQAARGVFDRGDWSQASLPSAKRCS
jgi:gamma-glutamyl-gamma-aminobutyraldehyde dehydrogenase